MKIKYDNAKRRLARMTETEPDLDALRAELGAVMTQAGTVRSRQEAAARVRFCDWEGQSDDYRKHAGDLGREALPFEGAADTRSREADKIVNERVAVYVESLMAGEVQVAPMGSDDVEAATKMTRVLRYVRDVQLVDELRREAELLGNYQEGDDPAVGVLKVWWKRETALELRTLSLDEVGLQVLQLYGVPLGPDGAPVPGTEGYLDEVGDLMYNPERRSEAVEVLAQIFPSVPPARLRRALRDLVRVGSADLPMPYVKENRLCFTALRFMEEVFFPVDIDDVQRSRVIYEREFLSEAELRERQHSEGWGEDFIDEALEAGPGPSGVDVEPLMGDGVARAADWLTGGERETDSLYEVWHAYTRGADEMGIPGIYRTVFSAKCRGDYYGLHQLLDYPHGDYPFILFPREAIARGMQHSRSVALIAGSAQHEIKVQRDCRTDYTQLSTIPPVKVRQRRGGLEMVLGPMVEVPVRDPDDVTWMNPPPFPQMSIEVERAAKADLNEYFGRMTPDVLPELRQSLLQKSINSWLGNWKAAWKQGVQLIQAYSPQMELSLVAGAPMQPLSREEIRGAFHLALAFNVNDLSLEFVLKRMQAIGQLLPWDTGGQIDRSVILRAAFRGIDPTLSELALRDTGAVTQSEVKDELADIALMAQGVEVPLKAGGVNAQLRLQTVMQTIQSSPTLARRYNQPQTPDDELFRELVENHVKNLRFLVQQTMENPQIGRTGAKPVLQQQN